ncbi:MAG: hypothetical protein QNJ11_11385 [Woeseiaceae bacterium]|nr:hypothetical protein [Woeseiaceae bacterium]
MADSGNKTGWQELREFADVDLTQSYVLSWQALSDTLLIDVDLYLEPGHPFYEQPRPAEKVCIRPALIEFPYVDSLRLGDTSPRQLYEIIGKIGHGAIEDLTVSGDGCYEIRGEFGTVSVRAERPILRLKGP